MSDETIIREREREEREREEREEAYAKADIEYKKSIRPVKVVGLDIPFGDVMWLAFQGFVASLIIAIPVAFIFLVIINS